MSIQQQSFIASLTQPQRFGIKAMERGRARLREEGVFSGNPAYLTSEHMLIHCASGALEDIMVNSIQGNGVLGSAGTICVWHATGEPAPSVFSRVTFSTCKVLDIAPNRNDASSVVQAPPSFAKVFFDRAQQMLDKQGEDEAISYVMAQIDGLMCLDKFLECDQVLAEADPVAHPISIVITCLAVSLPAKQRLPSRNGLYERAKAFYGRFHEDPIGLMVGLE